MGVEKKIRPVPFKREVDGETVYYIRGGDDTHARNFGNGRKGFVYLNLDGVTYNAKKGIGAKGKEVLSHEIGHLKDKKDYSGTLDDKAERHQEIVADLHMALRNRMGSKDYKRFVTDRQGLTASRTMKSPEYKSLSLDKRINLKDHRLNNVPHGKARKFLTDNWKRFRRFGLKESLGMSYIRYVLENYVIDEVSAKQKNKYLLRKITNRMLKKNAHLARFQAVPTPQPVAWQ